MAGTISSNTKITLKDVAYIIAMALWLNSIQNSVTELSLKIDGRLNLYEYRISDLENSTPGTEKNIMQSSAAIPPPRSPMLPRRKKVK